MLNLISITFFFSKICYSCRWAFLQSTHNFFLNRCSDMVSFYSRGECTPSTEVSWVYSALSWLFLLNSVHLVPLLTRSCRRSKVLAGPRSGWKWSSAGYGSLRRSVASLEVLWAGIPDCCNPTQIHGPYTLPFGSFSVADGAGRGCWVGRTPPPLHLLSGGSLLVEAGSWVKAVVVSQGLNTALVPICYLDKWLFANVFLVMER